MKMTIIGMSASAPGAISKAGKAFNIGALHTTAELAPAYAEGGIEKGLQGTSYNCDPEFVRKLAHLPLPFIADVDVRRVMRFGKPEDTVFDVKPMQTVQKAA